KRESSGRMPVMISLPGIAWHAPGRYGDFIGRTPSGTLAESILKGHDNIDHVKIINSGINSLKYFGKETEPQFDYTELSKAVRVCKKLGLKVMVHANGKRAVEISIKAGCDSIEHGFLMGKDNLKLMAEKGITWVPTLFPMKAYSRFLPKSSVGSNNANQYLDHQMEQLIHAHKYGVPIAVGTDAGSIGVHHGQAVMEEMRFFVSAGLSFEDSVRCASANGAELMGLDNEVGRLEPGFPSTFLLVRGAPENIFNSSHLPEMVFIKGKKIHSPAIQMT
ncbi:amidohydrolase family protein, partial [Thermodesulfobacteriota bacterium]